MPASGHPGDAPRHGRVQAAAAPDRGGHARSHGSSRRCRVARPSSAAGGRWPCACRHPDGSRCSRPMASRPPARANAHARHAAHCGRRITASVPGQARSGPTRRATRVSHPRHMIRERRPGCSSRTDRLSGRAHPPPLGECTQPPAGPRTVPTTARGTSPRIVIPPLQPTIPGTGAACGSERDRHALRIAAARLGDRLRITVEGAVVRPKQTLQGRRTARRRATGRDPRGEHGHPSCEPHAGAGASGMSAASSRRAARERNFELTLRPSARAGIPPPTH